MNFIFSFALGRKNFPVIFFLLFLAAQFNTNISFSLSQKLTPTPAKTVIAESTATEALDPKIQIEAIKAKREELSKTISLGKSRTTIASVTSTTPEMQNLNKHLDILQKIDLIYAQQISVLNLYKENQVKLEQISKALEKIRNATETPAISFLDWDIQQGDLNNVKNRKDSVDAEFKNAQTALDQAKSVLQEKESFLRELQENLSNASPDDKQVMLSELEAAQWETRSASETLRLNEFALAKETLERSTHTKLVDLLTERVKVTERNVTFTLQDLQTQLGKIKKESFDLNREIKKTSEQKDYLEKRLVMIRDKVSQTENLDRALLEDVKARQLERDALQIHLDNLNKNLERMPQRETAWQQRYSTFHGQVDYNQSVKWKADAKNILDSLDQADNLLTLQLSERQNELITLKNKIDNSKTEAASLLKNLESQQNSLQSIIQDLQEQKNTNEITRRLYQKLIQEINLESSIVTWDEYANRIFLNEFYGNKVSTWLMFLGSMLCIFAGLFLIRWMVIYRLKKSTEKKKFDIIPILVDNVHRTKPLFFLVVAVYFSSHWLDISDPSRKLLRNLTIIALILQGAVWISSLIRAWIFGYLVRKSKRDNLSLGTLSIFNFLSQLGVWSLAVLLALQNLGVDVSALIAGLGIGGVAIALSLQRILSDLFSSLSIVLDKPFVMGDFIVFDNFNYQGTVEHIGIKTTRLRSLTGEQIICSNSDLLDTRIRNFKRMNERRVSFTIGVVYNTPYEKLKILPQRIQQIVEAQSKVRFDRAHLKNYGEFSIIYETVYYVLDADYNVYMDIQQNINLEIFRIFQEEDIEFAYPTQTLYYQPKAPFTKETITDFS